MVPISEVIFEPIFPAIIKASMVDENSKIRVSRVPKPTNSFGYKGFIML